MKLKTCLLALALTCAACGYESKDNTLTGQPKRIHKNTPILCSDYSDVDVSLGVTRGGVGSMSVHDMKLYVPNASDVATLQKAADDGKLVKITYDTARVTFCVEPETVTKVEVLP